MRVDRRYQPSTIEDNVWCYEGNHPPYYVGKSQHQHWIDTDEAERRMKYLLARDSFRKSAGAITPSIGECFLVLSLNGRSVELSRNDSIDRAIRFLYRETNEKGTTPESHARI